MIRVGRNPAAMPGFFVVSCCSEHPGHDKKMKYGNGYNYNIDKRNRKIVQNVEPSITWTKYW
jgi:hypothetical protein